jgi:hypothetical protein
VNKVDIFLISIVILFITLCGVFLTAGYLRSLKSEVTSLRQEVKIREIELFDLKARLAVFEEIKVEVHFLDKSTYYDVVAVTDYFADEDDLIHEGEGKKND